MRRIAIISLIIVAVAASAVAGTLRGKVTYPDGSPYGSVSVTLTADGRSGTVYTGSDGVYVFQNVPAGECKVEVKTPKSTKSITATVTAAPITDLPPVTAN